MLKTAMFRGGGGNVCNFATERSLERLGGPARLPPHVTLGSTGASTTYCLSGYLESRDLMPVANPFPIWSSLHLALSLVNQEREVFVLSDGSDNEEDRPPAQPLAADVYNGNGAGPGSAYKTSRGYAGQTRTRARPEAGDVYAAAPKGKRKAEEEYGSYNSVAASTAGSITSIREAEAAQKRRRKDDPYIHAQHTGHTSHQQPDAYGSTAYHEQVPAMSGLAVQDPGYVSKTSQARSRNYAPQLPVDDKEGHFIVRKGENVTERYKIMQQLGQGTFGKVVECWDRREQKFVAIKIIRAIQKYRDASQIEIRVLKLLRQQDPKNENKCIHLIETFSYLNHVCIVSELLGQSVFDFLKENQFASFPPRHIWSFARQLLQSVAFLHRLSLVHTDLKPENILLVDSSYENVATTKRANAKKKRVLNNSEIRLIDFGSATFNNEYHSQVVSTRHYRAPEIILQMGWSYPCDAWSIGCILVEFYTGDALFQTHDNLEHLAMMEVVLGPMPEQYRRKAETYRPDFFHNQRLNWPNKETTPQSRRYMKRMKRLQEIVSGPVGYKKHNDMFLNLLQRLLEYDPERRITVAEALKHPYFSLVDSEFPGPACTHVTRPGINPPQ
ncbi:kinase-like protein [Ceraceosorus guamensis]|uniref:Kinase-like protein n=1 Tax=Ceraceosorus guamensis TaxID=1522189 RepID=A0A316W1R8_9BASI|nr:kinase-like protein [Ceraceosorus guamensis]PWN42491.1 kinase-like protein [Ceraceosorus guamensis]